MKILAIPNKNYVSVGAACRDSYLAQTCAKEGIDFSFLTEKTSSLVFASEIFCPIQVSLSEVSVIAKSAASFVT